MRYLAATSIGTADLDSSRISSTKWMDRWMDGSFVVWEKKKTSAKGCCELPPHRPPQDNILFMNLHDVKADL